jgi:threonine synthase
MPATRPQVWQGVISAYRDRLPVSTDTPVVTLHEGGTPLLPAPALSARTGCEVYLKVEGANPTGSFKDRGMTVAISMAAGSGAKAVICASTGNTSASAAAYAARAGLTCAVLVPRGKIAIGKLAQALVHGARLLQVDGSFDDCLELARKLAAEYPVALVNSVNPDRLQGQKTAAFEIVDELGDYRLLATREAVFGELASSASVAGLLKTSASGQIPAGSRVVCTITGNGLKDPDWALSGAPAPATIPADASAAATALGLA